MKKKNENCHGIVICTLSHRSTFQTDHVCFLGVSLETLIDTALNTTVKVFRTSCVAHVEVSVVTSFTRTVPAVASVTTRPAVSSTWCRATVAIATLNKQAYSNTKKKALHVSERESK